jgi:hypothetical protein
MPIKGGYLLAAGGGAILLYSGIRGHRWSNTLRHVISGQPLPKTTDMPILTSAEAFQSDSGGTPGTSGPLPTGGTATKNKAIAKILAVPYGWSTGAQWAALDWVWTHESNWDNHARNPTSGAYGIPQALPASKMGGLANPPTSSAAAQIRWGLRYIKSTYGSPVATKAFWQAHGWY